ncbi:hypothetical protein PTTG_09752 [Puccinia triticina 1-1 BBBD Race 1]|uniref:Uncharacterized protein n=1 Tax=Puccinia triticina (isolate 1-1 / race 1 (BBBD)) TaxID=630390 RepID=A0A0C4F984_PUCT1|nr:hypothetical protein PTTG_09752 [Puccinia triticina 1-1 BBBD Race 1]
METEDMLDHIDSVAKVAGRLEELITEGRPLTIDEIHATALINSLPSDWINCISSLMNQPHISAEQVAMALRISSTKAKHQAKKSSSFNSSN